MSTYKLRYIHVHKSKQEKANGGTQGRHKFQRQKPNCPEQDLNLRSLAFMTSTLVHKAAQQAGNKSKYYKGNAISLINVN